MNVCAIPVYKVNDTGRDFILPSTGPWPHPIHLGSWSLIQSAKLSGQKKLLCPVSSTVTKLYGLDRKWKGQMGGQTDWQTNMTIPIFTPTLGLLGF